MKYEDIETPEQLYIYMKNNIKYGFVSKKDKKKYIRKELNNDELYEKELVHHYYLQSPEELQTTKCGLCYDQVEYERKWFLSHNYEVKTYFTSYHNHVFLIYKEENNYCFFERTCKETSGIYKRRTLKEVLNLYKEQQIKINPEITKNNIVLYEYKSIKYGSSFDEIKQIQNKMRKTDI